MPGFDNSIVIGDGIDLSGDFPPENQLDTDGKLLIGSSTGNPGAAVPTSTDSAVSIVVGDGTLDFQIGSGVQPRNVDLDAVASISGTGIAVKQAVGSWVARTLQAGAGISIANANGVSGDPEISASGSFTWNVITATSQAISVSNGYIANHAVSVIDFTLPATANPGDSFKIVGRGAGLWKISQNAGQTIYYGDQNTTTGVGGSLDAILQRDCVEVVCVNTDVDFQVVNSQGNLTVV